MAALRPLPAVVEEWGWDEAFVGASTDDPEALARRLKDHLLAETGLTCAVGIGETKLQAKTATGFAKPGGIARLTRRTWFETMGDRPVTAIWGIGGRTARRLADSRHPHGDRAGHARTTVTWRSGSVRRSGPTSSCSVSAATTHRSSTSLTCRDRASREETFEHDLTSPPRSTNKSPAWRPR